MLLLLGAAPVAAQQGRPAQTTHRQDFQPVSAEVFALLTQFYDLDAGLPLDPRTVEAWEEGGLRHEKVVFTTGNGERVPGELVLPGGDGPFPLTLLLHGLGADRTRWWREDRSGLAETLLAAGVAVLAIDLRFHGERAALNDYQNPVYLTFGDSLFTRNRDMIIGSAIDALRALAYADTRSELDPQRRAIAGYSMGAMIALYLSVLADRLSGVVAAAVPTTLQPLPIDHFQFAPRARAPVLLQVGSEDWLSSPADAKRLRALLPVAGSELRFYDAGHSLPAPFAVEAAEWLVARLR